MNNSTDFQPTTRNPQSEVGGGLQPKSAPLQPLTSSGQAGELNPNQLPKTNSLKVTTATNGSSAQLAPTANLQVTNAVSSGWFFAAVTILTVFIFWFLGKVFNSPKSIAAIETAKPVVAEKPVTASKPKKKSNKKKTGKKNVKKRK